MSRAAFVIAIELSPWCSDSIERALAANRSVRFPETVRARASRSHADRQRKKKARLRMKTGLSILNRDGQCRRADRVYSSSFRGCP